MVDTVLIDFDGVLTNGKINITHDGQFHKEVHSRDLRAIRELIAKGVRVVIVTASSSDIVKIYAEKVKAELIVSRQKGEININNFGIFAFICDDVWDMELAKKANFIYCPSDADLSVRQLPGVHILESPGGGGVIAELVKLLYEAN